MNYWTKGSVLGIPARCHQMYHQKGPPGSMLAFLNPDMGFPFRGSTEFSCPITFSIVFFSLFPLSFPFPFCLFLLITLYTLSTPLLTAANLLVHFTTNHRHRHL